LLVNLFWVNQIRRTEKEINKRDKDSGS